jgi:hypothetical protein
MRLGNPGMREFLELNQNIFIPGYRNYIIRLSAEEDSKARAGSRLFVHGE